MTFFSKGSSRGKEWISCRDVLWYLVFFGFSISYMLRLNVSLTIVAMVVPRPKAAATFQCKNDIQQTSNLSSLWVNASSVTNFEEHNVTHIFQSPFELTTRFENTTPVNPIEYNVDQFEWSEYEQGLALGGYYWIHWATQLPGGLLARRYGTKLVFGLANLGTALLGFLLPISARYHLYAFVFVRFLQGLVEGAIWPSMHHMTAKWIPIHDRSRFISSYVGSSVGAAVTYPLCAILIDCFGWASVFYITSLLGVIWYVAWYYLAYDTPQEHPRISEAEKSYILKHLGDSVSQFSSKPVPWKAMLTSGPLWITAIVSCGANWGLLTLMSEAPSYFNYIHGWNIGATGVLSAAPHVIRMLFAYAFSSLADWILRTRKMSTTNLRKFAMFVCNGVQSVMLLGLAFSGCHPILAIVFMIAGLTASGTLSAGILASCIDLSPNYASINLGLINTLTLPSGFISPMIVGFLTDNNQTIEQWRLVFLITVAIIFSTGVLYMIVGTSDVQPWNNVGNEEIGEELQRLRSNLDEAIKHDESIDVITDQKNDTVLAIKTHGVEKNDMDKCTN